MTGIYSYSYSIMYMYIKVCVCIYTTYFVFLRKIWNIVDHALLQLSNDFRLFVSSRVSFVGANSIDFYISLSLVHFLIIISIVITIIIIIIMCHSCPPSLLFCRNLFLGSYLPYMHTTPLWEMGRWRLTI